MSQLTTFEKERRHCWLHLRQGMVDKPVFQWGKTEWYTGGDEARWLKP